MATTRRNMRLGIMNGVLFYAADAFSDAALVLTLFVRQLGASSLIVALLPALRNGGWALPQMLNAGRVQALTYKIVSYRRAGLIRWVIWLGMVLVVAGAVWLPAWLALTLFLLLFGGYNLSAGFGALAFQDVVAKTVPVQRRGRFFGARNFLGGLLGFFGAGAAVRWLLSSASPLAFPFNYAALMAISFVLIGFGVLAFARIDEPPTVNPPAPVGARTMLGQIPALLRRDRIFRHYLISRMTTRLTLLADAFYGIYATEVLHVRPRMIGIYLAVRVITAAGSNVLWAWVADRHGNRRLTLLTNALLLVIPLVALGCLLLQGHVAPDTLGWLFTSVFALSGLTADGVSTAQLTYVMELAPERERPQYVGVLNTLLGIMTFTLVLGGVVVDLWGYEVLFILTALAGVVALAQSWHLHEPRFSQPLEAEAVPA